MQDNTQDMEPKYTMQVTYAPSPCDDTKHRKQGMYYVEGKRQTHKNSFMAGKLKYFMCKKCDRDFQKDDYLP